MPDYDYKVGDRVIYVRKTTLYGERGEVVSILNRTDASDRPTGEVFYAVRFDCPVPRGHSCTGLCERGYGRWCISLELSLDAPTVDPAEFLQLLGGDHGIII